MQKCEYGWNISLKIFWYSDSVFLKTKSIMFIYNYLKCKYRNSLIFVFLFYLNLLEFKLYVKVLENIFISCNFSKDFFFIKDCIPNPFESFIERFIFVN